MSVATEARILLAARLLVVFLPLWLLGGRVAVDAALSLTAVLFLVRSAMTRDWQWARSVWFRLGVALWLWMLFISLFAFDLGLSFGQAAPWIRFLVFAAALEAWVLDEVWMRRLLWTATVVVLFVAGDTWLQYLSGSDVFGHARPADNRLSGPFDGLRTGIFITKMMFPVVLGAFAWQACRKAVWPRVALLAMVSLILSAVFISGERMALLLALAGLALAAMLQKGVERRWLGGMAGLAVIGVVVLVGADARMLDRHVAQTVQTVQGFHDSPYSEIWRSALHLAAERPLLGVGMKNFRVACDDPVIGLPASVINRCTTHPHNLYLEFLAEAGLPGLLIFVSLVLAWVRRLWCAWRVQPHYPWLLGPMVAVAIMLWPLGPSSSFFSNWFGGIFWLSLGWALAAARLRDNAPRTTLDDDARMTA